MNDDALVKLSRGSVKVVYARSSCRSRDGDDDDHDDYGDDPEPQGDVVQEPWRAGVSQRHIPVAGQVGVSSL